MRTRYWFFFYEITYKSYYYKSFQMLFLFINWCISAFLSLTTLSCITAWSFWNDHATIWAIIICASQILQALFPKLPYNDLLISNRFMVCALDKLLLDIERTWLTIDLHNLPDDEILNQLTIYQQRYSDLVNQFFSGEYLPSIILCEKSAEKYAQTYFSNNYQTERM